MLNVVLTNSANHSTSAEFLPGVVPGYLEVTEDRQTDKDICLFGFWQ